MFGLFKKKKKSEVENLIEKDGIEYAAERFSEVILQKIPTVEIAYQFVLEEIEAASQGNEKAKSFAKNSGISPQLYIGSMSNSRPEVDGPGGPQQFILALCMQLQPNVNLSVELRTKIVDNIMKALSFGKYDNKLGCSDYDGDRFWEWASANCNRVKFEPKEIENWEDIEELDLQANELSELPDDIKTHRGLVDLNLFENNFSSVPASIFCLSQLMYLNLGFNRITTLPGNIGKLKNLKILDLSFNQLDSLPSELGELMNLEQLIVHHNCLTGLPKEIGDMTGLKHIALSDNNLSSLPEEILKLKNLKTIELQNNSFSEEHIRSWTEKFSGSQCRISFGSTKGKILETIRVVESINGGRPDDSLLEKYLNSDDGEVVENIFSLQSDNEDEHDMLSRLLRKMKYKNIFINEGLNAIDSSGNITPIELVLHAESPSDESDLIEWAQIVYIETCKKYCLKPNARLQIASVATSGETKTIAFMER